MGLFLSKYYKMLSDTFYLPFPLLFFQHVFLFGFLFSASPLEYIFYEGKDFTFLFLLL